MMHHEHNKRAINSGDSFHSNANLDHKWSLFSSPWLFHFSNYICKNSSIPDSSRQLFPSKKSRMSSFSLELQVRASQELVAKQMPKRSILVRAMLFAETASALLLIEFGLFTHPAMIVLPFFLMALVSLPREDFSKGEKFQCLELRSFFSSLLTPKHYSAFGLRRRQENTRLFVWPMMIFRLVCVVVVTMALSHGCVVGCPYYRCNVETKRMMASFGNESMTLKVEECLPEGASISDDAIERMCDNFEGAISYRGVFPDSIVPLGYWSLCDPRKAIIPGLLTEACKNGDLDPVAYQSCLSTVYLSGFCDQVFLFCSSIRDQDSGLGRVLVAAHMFVPMCGFGLLILLHLLPVFFCQADMMNVPENKDLRQAIRARTRELQQELQTGRPESSLWWDRRAFEFKMSFLVIDVLLDAWSCFSFFRDGSWGFAVCQLLLLLISFFVELRSVGVKTFFFAIAESWKAGLPSDLDPVISVCFFSLNLRPPTVSSRSPQPHSPDRGCWMACWY